MSRILLLLVMVLWMCRSVAPSMHNGMYSGTALFLGGLLLVVLFMGLWSRVLARHLHDENLHRSLQRFHHAMFITRLLIPVWFGIALYGLGWADLVSRLMGPMGRWPIELPGMLLGITPPVLAWMALWWAQFPADHALREQSLLIQLDEDLPVHAPPSFWKYFAANFRMQVLFTVVPVALIVFLYDIAAIVLWQGWGVDLRDPTLSDNWTKLAIVLQMCAILIMVLIAPEILRRILPTEPLPDSPLRRRLEELCRRTKLRYREILLWKTNNSMSNAAVMGLIPQVRYVLLSDMLLETMTDRQIEAVFAHEIGHVKHWHMGWYVVLVKTLLLMGLGPGQLLIGLLQKNHPHWLTENTIDTVETLLGIGVFALIFGFLSRWFERQADVFAARTMQHEPGNEGMLSIIPGEHITTYVGPQGAATFASALHRVAIINNIPLSARNFTHGSIADRMDYLHALSGDPTRTFKFDRSMSVIYACMILGLLACGAWALVTLAT